MLKRSITGAIILLVTAGFIALRQVSLLFFDAFALAIIYGAITEMVLANKFANKTTSNILLFLYPVALLCIYLFSTSLSMALLLQIATFIVYFIILMARELIKNAIIRKNGDTLTDTTELNNSLLADVKNTLSIMLYPATILGFLFGINHFGLNLGYVGIIMTFAISMFTDVFAYMFGCMLRGPKMCPEISPKKSISGMIFGALGGMLASGLGYFLFVRLGIFGASFENIKTAIVVVMFVLMGILGTFATQFGDLVASAHKRKVGIKDFGSIFPGHGGFMDRVDGLMFTGALIYVLFALFV